VSHTKYDPSLVDYLLHLDEIAQVRRHRFLAQDMVSLPSKGHDDVLVHMVMYGDDDGVCQALSGGLERLCGRLEEILPRMEDEGVADGVRLGEEGAGVEAGLCDRDDVALVRLIEGVGCVVLWGGFSVCSGGRRWETCTVPRWPQPMTARVMGIPFVLMLVLEERG
jgi:hypothetical protein